ALARAPPRACPPAGQAALHAPRSHDRADRRGRDGRDVPDAGTDRRLTGAGGSLLVARAQAAQLLIDAILVLLTGATIALDLDVDLFAEDGNGARRLDPDPDLLPHDDQPGHL